MSTTTRITADQLIEMTDIKVLTENDQLEGQDVVPGFACRVGEIFADK